MLGGWRSVRSCCHRSLPYAVRFRTGCPMRTTCPSWSHSIRTTPIGMASLVSQFTGREAAVVDNDHASALSHRPQGREDVERVRKRLRDAGYEDLE